MCVYTRVGVRHCVLHELSPASTALNPERPVLRLDKTELPRLFEKSLFRSVCVSPCIGGGWRSGWGFRCLLFACCSRCCLSHADNAYRDLQEHIHKFK